MSEAAAASDDCAEDSVANENGSAAGDSCTSSPAQLHIGRHLCVDTAKSLTRFDMILLDAFRPLAERYGPESDPLPASSHSSDRSSFLEMFRDLSEDTDELPAAADDSDSETDNGPKRRSEYVVDCWLFI